MNTPQQESAAGIKLPRSGTVFLSVKSVASTGELSQGSTFAENQVQSFARVARTPIVH